MGINHPLRLVALWGGYDVGTESAPTQTPRTSLCMDDLVTCQVSSLRISNYIVSPRRLLSDLCCALLLILVRLNRLQ